VTEELRVDTSSGDAATGDQFLLASDGLTRLVADDELAAVLTSRPADMAAEELVDTVLERGAPDNITLVIIRLV
jgi:serine/threonine protein phosphatase PrpC